MQDVIFSENGSTLTATPTCEIDHHTAKDMREEIDKAINFYMPTLLILDFSGISFMDSSGIGLVMGRYKNLKKNGAKLSISNLSGNIYKIMKLAGIERLAEIEKGD